MFKLLGKLLDSNEKELSKIRPIVGRINDLGIEYKKLKDKEFTQKTAEIKERIASGTILDDLLPEAYALVREATLRTLGLRHYDVQLLAGISLHKGRIAEQKTGEGKTLSAVPPLYLNALTGKGAHLVTVNDYLARRDAGWMGPIYHILGVSVSAIINDQSFIFDPSFDDPNALDWRLKHLRPISRKEAYLADITYGINSEFGFDYLRDNMATDTSQLVQREYHYAVVDEVDSVLVDEARTPHIISAPDTEATHKYYDYAKLVDKLSKDTDYVVDEKLRTAHLSDHGILKVEKMLGIGNIYEKDFETVHHIEAALKSRTLFQKERDYIVKDGQVIIVDEFTGRLLMGRRFSEGIHQAIEAKEGVAIQQESKTLATVSLQNYFRMYQKLAGMTGTAATEAEEFNKIYQLEVIVVPTHKTMIRQDFSDSVYKTTRAKYSAVVNEIIDCYKRGQPVLVGTTSIDKNEIVSEFLKRKGIPHQVLNAKNHLREAMIIAEAGKKGAVTVATNMAGRGVDIILGGSRKERWEVSEEISYDREEKEWKRRHEDVVVAGGLRVIGTERHESRRIDNQLRGRSGRQGDPGSSRFYVSLEDDIMRLFGGEQVSRLMDIFKMPEDVPLEHAMVSKAIEQAQVKVEGFHFDSRKHLVEYDDVIAKQREIIYRRRRKILQGVNQKEEILGIIAEEIKNIVIINSADKDGHLDAEKIVAEFASIIPFDPESQKNLILKIKEFQHQNDVDEFLINLAKNTYENKEKQTSPDLMRQIEQWVSLSVIDNLWMEHLAAIDDLREGIGLRGYGQRDPLVEYKNEAFNLFERLISFIDSNIAHRIFKVQVQLSQVPQVRDPRPDKHVDNKNVNTPSFAANAPRKLQTNAPVATQTSTQKNKKLGRNDPCWCGSGKKWKRCHYPQLG